MCDFDSLLAQVRETSVHQATASETYAELYRQLLRDSLQHDVSHIHLHCSLKDLIVRYRVANRMQLRGVLPSEAADGLFGAIKSQCGLDLLESRRPQDGRAIYPTEHGQRTIHVSVLPAFRGPAAVLEWETPDLKCLELHELGLLADQQSQLAEMLQRRVGFVSVSGHARTGKRTLGHALLLAARSDGKEVISLEWGVSRPLPGILQCDFAAPSNLTHLQWIQAALRRRPDALFIEHFYSWDTIKDLIAAARNKCLVIAVIGPLFEHMVDMLQFFAVPRSATTEALLGVVEQRLLPTVCRNCAMIYTPKASELRELRIRCADPQRLSFARGQGCSACRGSGRGAFVGVHELAMMTNDLRDMFVQQKPTETVRQHLLDSGMTTLYQSAVHKLVTRQIASTTAIAYCQNSWREPKVWLNVDPDTGLSRRSDGSDVE